MMILSLLSNIDLGHSWFLTPSRCCGNAGKCNLIGRGFSKSLKNVPERWISKMIFTFSTKEKSLDQVPEITNCKR